MSDQEEKKATPKKETVPKVTKKATPKKETENQYITDNKYPTLVVENFGKIKHAEIELAPFTLFVGDNNSGKSYLMNLIWGLRNNQLIYNDFIFKNISEYSEQISYKEINKYIQTSYQKYLDQDKKNQNIIIPNNIILSVIELINILLQDQSPSFIKEIFNIENDSISIDKIEIRLPKSYKLNIPVEIITFPYRKTGNKKDGLAEFIDVLMVGMSGNEIPKNKDYLEFITLICVEVMNSIFSRSTLFLPSSRTGFTLLKGDLKGQAVDDFLDDIDDKVDKLALKLDLTYATKEFVRQYFKLKSVEYKKNNLLELIEDEIINGNVYLEDIGLNGIKYKPHNSEHSYEAKNTSAVVTELAPLILFLQYQNNWKTLLMEEPEISLHPQLQQQIARVLIKLVNTGKNIFITTHSDTIIQHINNMIKLSNNSKERQQELCTEYNYPIDILDSEKKVSSDIIELDKVRMYEFIVNTENKTEVTSLQGDKNGFSQPKFQQVLTKIYNESVELTHYDEDDEC